MAETGDVLAKPKTYSSNWLVGIGALHVILGLSAILVPVLATVALEVFLGSFLLVSGIFQLIHSFKSEYSGDHWVAMFTSLLYVVIGAYLLVFIESGVIALTLAVGIMFIFIGFLRFVQAFQTIGSSKGWVISSGLVTFALGLLILYGLPDIAVWVLGFVLGFDLILIGANMLSWAYYIKSLSAV